MGTSTLKPSMGFPPPTTFTASAVPLENNTAAKKKMPLMEHSDRKGAISLPQVFFGPGEKVSRSRYAESVRKFLAHHSKCLCSSLGWKLANDLTSYFSALLPHLTFSFPWLLKRSKQDQRVNQLPNASKIWNNSRRAKFVRNSTAASDFSSVTWKLQAQLQPIQNIQLNKYSSKS